LDTTIQRAILVLGGKGYSGSSISSYLESSGHTVFKAGHGCGKSNYQPNLEFDLTDQSKYYKAIDDLSVFSPDKITAVINCAGRSKRLPHNASLTLNTQETILDLSHDSRILLNLIYHVMLHRKNYGQDMRVIDIGSIWAHEIPYSDTYLDLNNEPDLSVILSKTVKLRTIKYFAKYALKQSFLINQITPGWFPRPGKTEREDYIQGITSRIPLGRIGYPNDLNAAVSFLLDPTNLYCNGTEIVIDGGHDIY
jgi:NAD(P)-dependent dehydrogenase (short-subunit alcohol dehydrogenase family)